jgi:Effector Associated Constant Component 1
VEVRVVLEPDSDADGEEIERLRRQLGAEMRSLDAEFSTVASQEAPPGSKGIGGVMTEWLVTLSASGGVLVTLIATVNDWLGRRADAQRIKVTIDGDTLELGGVTSEEQAELIRSFIQRHQPK